MQKVFANKNIFDSDADYVIGGFYTDKNEGFDIDDFQNHLLQRIENLVKDYIDDANNVNQEWGFGEDSMDKAKEQLGLILKDNLDIFVPYTQTNFVVDGIYNHPKVQKWLLEIRKKIKDSATTATYLSNEINSLSSKEKQNAEYFTNAGFEEFIEKISRIEL